jgi:hypothetical protein
MKLLCFQARAFHWKTFEKTLPQAPDRDVDKTVRDAVVAFVHVESADDEDGRAASVRRQAIKHLKWLANKRDLKNVVLHSFTHLGGDSADPARANVILEELAERLGASGYVTDVTAFGYLHEWSIDVYGESLAKVWKEI